MKSESLAARLNRLKTAKPVARVTTPARHGGWPLSYGQQRIWTFEQIHPGTATYNMPVAYRLKGALDVAVLRVTFAEIVRRHEALRTVFRPSATEGEGTAEVDAEARFGWEFHDFSGQSPSAAESAARA